MRNQRAVWFRCGNTFKASCREEYIEAISFLSFNLYPWRGFSFVIKSWENLQTARMDSARVEPEEIYDYIICG